MQEKSFHTNRWIVLSLLVVIMLALVVATDRLGSATAAAYQAGGGSGDPPTPILELNCKKTEVAGQCGTNDDQAPVVCGPGQPTCVQIMIRYGNITNCIGGAKGGLKDCAAGMCKKTTTSFHCVQGVCMPCGDPVVEDVIPVSFATGEACSNPVPVVP